MNDGRASQPDDGKDVSANPAQRSDETIFSDALALPQSKREVFLDAACFGDPARRARIESLLRMPEEAPEFMATGAVEVATSASDASAGDMIGRYKLLQKIGEGGIGVVFMAEQEEPIRRRVAVKVIKLGMDTKEVIARFEAERQALALMDHPNIARVFDAGATATGRPFFVMELVRGIPITKFCDEQNLPTRARLDLFTHVCHAVQHAHQKGIIHRDLKPSNILVTLHDGIPVPKVIDFGIAKATQGRLTDATLFTAFEQFIGTPAYMSPEQAEMSGLDIDTRSDIYSLGVLLYELLTGRPPFDPKFLCEAGLHEIRRIIREVDPPRPSTRLTTLGDVDRATIAKQRDTVPARLMTLMRGDLDWIVMRCLEKDRSRRYETANALALDVLRHLHDETVVARPPNALYRFRKLFRRNRLAFGAGMAVAAALVIGLAVATWRYAREKTARQAEAEARTLADQRRAEVETINRFLVTDMLGSANPEVTQGREITVKDVLNNAAARVTKAFAGNPLLEATLRTTIGETYRVIGAYDFAEPHLVAALETRRRLLGADHLETLETQRSLGNLHLEANRTEESEKVLRDALERHRRRLGANHEQTLQTANDLCHALGHNWKSAEADELARDTWERVQRHLPADHRVTLKALAAFAGSAFMQGRTDEAYTLSIRLLETQRRVLGKEHPDTISTIHDLGAALNDLRRYAEAETLLREGLAASQRLHGPGQYLIARLQMRLLASLRGGNKHTEANELLATTLDAARKAGGSIVQNAWHVVSAHTQWLRRQRRPEEAIPLLRDWNDVLRRSNSDSVTLFACVYQLGLALHEAGRHAEAEPMLREALMEREKMPENYRRFTVQFNLGRALAAQRKPEEAERHLLAAYRGLRGVEPKIHIRDRESIFLTIGALLELYRQWPRAEQVESWQRELLDYEKHAGRQRADWNMFNRRATALRSDKTRSAEMLRLRQLMLAAQTEQLGRGHPDTLLTLQALANDYTTLKQWAEAEPLVRDLLEERLRKNAADSVVVANAQATLGSNLLAQKKFVEAESVLRTVLATREKKIPDDYLTFNARSMLGAALAGQKKYADAEPLLLSGYEGIKVREAKLPGATKLRLREAIERLVQFYTDRNYVEKTAAWRRMLDEFMAAQKPAPGTEP